MTMSMTNALNQHTAVEAHTHNCCCLEKPNALHPRRTRKASFILTDLKYVGWVKRNKVDACQCRERSTEIGAYKPSLYEMAEGSVWGLGGERGAFVWSNSDVLRSRAVVGSEVRVLGAGVLPPDVQHED